MHDNLRSRAAFNRLRDVDAASAEAQVADFRRKVKAVGWEDTDLRKTSTTESGVTGAKVVSVGILSHEY
jgi:hypothetical protein